MLHTFENCIKGYTDTLRVPPASGRRIAVMRHQSALTTLHWTAVELPIRRSTLREQSICCRILSFKDPPLQSSVTMKMLSCAIAPPDSLNPTPRTGTMDLSKRCHTRGHQADLLVGVGCRRDATCRTHAGHAAIEAAGKLVSMVCHTKVGWANMQHVQVCSVGWGGQVAKQYGKAELETVSTKLAPVIQAGAQRRLLDKVLHLGLVAEEPAGGSR